MVTSGRQFELVTADLADVENDRRLPEELEQVPGNSRDDYPGIALPTSRPHTPCRRPSRHRQESKLSRQPAVPGSVCGRAQQITGCIAAVGG
jgi:hypothetical protein